MFDSWSERSLFFWRRVVIWSLSGETGRLCNVREQRTWAADVEMRSTEGHFVELLCGLTVQGRTVSNLSIFCIPFYSPEIGWARPVYTTQLSLPRQGTEHGGKSPPCGSTLCIVRNGSTIKAAAN